MAFQRKPFAHFSPHFMHKDGFLCTSHFQRHFSHVSSQHQKGNEFCHGHGELSSGGVSFPEKQIH